MSNEILRKLTIKGCGLGVTEIKAAVTAETKSADLLKVVGITTGAKPGQTDKGEYLKLMGTFRAVNLLTGEVFDSAQAILPSFISDGLAVALAQSDEVEFALVIGAKYDKSAVTEYAYTVRPLIEAKVSDKMAALLDAAKFDEPAALPAPTAPAAPAAKPAAKKAA